MFSDLLLNYVFQDLPTFDVKLFGLDPFPPSPFEDGNTTALIVPQCSRVFEQYGSVVTSHLPEDHFQRTCFTPKNYSISLKNYSISLNPKLLERWGESKSFYQLQNQAYSSDFSYSSAFWILTCFKKIHTFYLQEGCPSVCEHPALWEDFDCFSACLAGWLAVNVSL